MKITMEFIVLMLLLTISYFIGTISNSPKITGQTFNECTISKPAGTKCVERIERGYYPMEVE